MYANYLTRVDAVGVNAYYTIFNISLIWRVDECRRASTRADALGVNGA